jgi:hypothetical protein
MWEMDRQDILHSLVETIPWTQFAINFSAKAIGITYIRLQSIWAVTHFRNFLYLFFDSDFDLHFGDDFLYNVRFEFLTAVCYSVQSGGCFGVTNESIFWIDILKMAQFVSPKRFETYQVAWHHIPEIIIFRIISVSTWNMSNIYIKEAKSVMVL